jgi:hypothetical protein
VQRVSRLHPESPKATPGSPGSWPVSIIPTSAYLPRREACAIACMVRAPVTGAGNTTSPTSHMPRGRQPEEASTRSLPPEMEAEVEGQGAASLFSFSLRTRTPYTQSCHLSQLSLSTAWLRDKVGCAQVPTHSSQGKRWSHPSSQPLFLSPPGPEPLARSSYLYGCSPPRAPGHHRF